MLLHVSSMYVQAANCKGNLPTSSYSRWYWARSRVSVLTTSWCISQKNQVGFENHDKSFDFSDGKHFFMGGIQLLRSHQMTKIPVFSSTHFQSIDVQNFTSIPPAAPGSQLHKYHKYFSPECFSCPPYTYGTNDLDFDWVNYTRDLGSLFSFSSL